MKYLHGMLIHLVSAFTSFLMIFLLMEWLDMKLGALVLGMLGRIVVLVVMAQVFTRKGRMVAQ